MRIVLSMEDGIIQDILAESEAIEICLLELDDPDPTHLSYAILERNGQLEELHAWVMEPDWMDPDRVEAIFKQILDDNNPSKEQLAQIYGEERAEEIIQERSRL